MVVDRSAFCVCRSMPSSLRAIVHRGSHQIGGSCIELATDHHRLLIDAGSPLDDSQPNELPPIAGVSLPGPPPDAVLLSHAHADHSGLLGCLPSEVPVWMTSGTSKMLLAGEVFCGQPPVPRDRQRKLQPGKPERIGDFTVTALPVDHSIFGAVAFLIEAAGRRVLYSGDLRLHGRKPGMTRHLVEVATAAPLDLLLIEGTHLSRSMDATATTEWELENQISDLISGAPGLALAFFSPQHLDRLVTFYKATRRAGRTLVIDLYAAFVMHLLRSEAGIPDPARGPSCASIFRSADHRSRASNDGSSPLESLSPKCSPTLHDTSSYPVRACSNAILPTCCQQRRSVYTRCGAATSDDPTGWMPSMQSLRPMEDSLSAIPAVTLRCPISSASSATYTHAASCRSIRSDRTRLKISCREWKSRTMENQFNSDL